MRLVATLCLLLALWTVDLCAAERCASICSTEVLWGVGSAEVNYQTCQCEGTTGAARTGPNCGCGVCYVKQDGHVMGYAQINGSCQSGMTDCSNCDTSSSSSGASSSSTPTPTSKNSTSSSNSSTSTSSPTSGASSVNGSTTAPPASSNASGSVSPPAPTDARGSVSGASGTRSPSGSSSTGANTSSSSGSSGLATWQIALIICSCVLVFAVIIVTILSCYCKSKNKMHEFMDEENDSREYEGYWHAHGDEPKGQPGAFMDLAAMQSGSSHSRPNSARNLQQPDPNYSDGGVPPPHSVGRRHSLGTDQAPAPGLAPRSGNRHSVPDQAGLYQQQFRDRPPSRSLGSTADLPQVYQPLPRERPSPESWNRRMPEVEL